MTKTTASTKASEIFCCDRYLSIMDTTNQLRVSGMLVDPLSETEAERLRDFYDSIANYVLPNASLVNFIESEFAGYFQDTENYESAAVNFSRKYALYLNE